MKDSASGETSKTWDLYACRDSRGICKCRGATSGLVADLTTLKMLQVAFPTKSEYPSEVEVPLAVSQPPKALTSSEQHAACVHVVCFVWSPCMHVCASWQCQHCQQIIIRRVGDLDFSTLEKDSVTHRQTVDLSSHGEMIAANSINSQAVNEGLSPYAHLMQRFI